MKVILLEKIENLGIIGNVADVKSGYARNYLLPQRKALRATKANLAYFEKKRSEIEAKNAKSKQEAMKLAESMKNITVILVRQASESGFLFGSVRPNDIVSELEKQNIKIAKSQLKIKNPLKTIGSYQIGICLHPEVVVDITLRIETPRQQEFSDDSNDESVETESVPDSVTEVLDEE